MAPAPVISIEPELRIFPRVPVIKMPSVIDACRFGDLNGIGHSAGTGLFNQQAIGEGRGSAIELKILSALTPAVSRFQWSMKSGCDFPKSKDVFTVSGGDGVAGIVSRLKGGSLLGIIRSTSQDIGNSFERSTGGEISQNDLVNGINGNVTSCAGCL